MPAPATSVAPNSNDDSNLDPDAFNPLAEDLIQERDLLNADNESIGGNRSNLSSVAESFDGAFSSVSTASKKRKISDTNDLFREFLSNRPKPSDFIPQKPDDDIQTFCDSIAKTLRKLSPLAIARAKLKIANIVGEEEIAWAQQPTTEYVLVEQNPTVQLLTSATVITQNSPNETNDEMDQN